VIEIGRYRVVAIQDGTFALDGGTVFGSVPKEVWQREFPPDERNRVRLAARCLLVCDQDAGRHILIDDGLGDLWDARQQERYAAEKSASGLMEGLRSCGIAPADVTDVILSHLHFDGAGGTASRGADGRMALAFPKAVYHLQRRHWQWARSPSERDAGVFLEQLELLQRSNRLHLIDGEGELFPDIELIVSEGHTVAQQLPRIHGENTHLTFCGDLIPTRAHLRLTWGMAYDLYPLTTVEEKKVILAQALEEDGILFFEHDPQVAACRLGEAAGEPVFREAVAL
jgi:glyoxylase-like metal-dependent hydrolase (beta-lactamase superfamily II)